jgi:hypothetical protein
VTVSEADQKANYLNLFLSHKSFPWLFNCSGHFLMVIILGFAIPPVHFIVAEAPRRKAQSTVPVVIYS